MYFVIERQGVGGAQTKNILGCFGAAYGKTVTRLIENDPCSSISVEMFLKWLFVCLDLNPS